MLQFPSMFASQQCSGTDVSGFFKSYSFSFLWWQGVSIWVELKKKITAYKAFGQNRFMQVFFYPNIRNLLAVLTTLPASFDMWGWTLILYDCFIRHIYKIGWVMNNWHDIILNQSTLYTVLFTAHRFYEILLKVLNFCHFRMCE